jgi:hypothetical protein
MSVLQGHKVCKAYKVFKAMLALLELQAHRATLDQQALKEFKVIQVQQDHKVFKVMSALLARLVHRVFKESKAM